MDTDNKLHTFLYTLKKVSLTTNMLILTILQRCSDLNVTLWWHFSSKIMILLSSYLQPINPHKFWWTVLSYNLYINLKCSCKTTLSYIWTWRTYFRLLDSVYCDLTKYSVVLLSYFYQNTIQLFDNIFLSYKVNIPKI